MPFNTPLNAAFAQADRVELDNFFATTAFTGGQIVLNTTLGTFFFSPSQSVVINDAGLAVNVPDTSANTHNILFLLFKPVAIGDVPGATP